MARLPQIHLDSLGARTGLGGLAKRLKDLANDF